jgi:hypothetical protein
MKATLRTVSAIALASVSAATFLGGCAAPPRTTTVPAATAVPVVTYPAASPATTIIVPPAAPQRVTYPEGAYELYGSGTVGSPYYWVWIPRGSQTLPPPPPLPPVR